MIECNKIQTLISEEELPSKQTVLDVVSFFFIQEWPTVDPETLTVTFNTGFTDTNCSVSRPPSSAPTEPLKVFLKIHRKLESDIKAFKHLVPKKHQEALLCDEYAKSGLGAKVYGFFETPNGVLGRVDEFLEARTLEPEDVQDEAIRADVARAHAAFHSMETGLSRSPVGAYYEAVISGLQKYHCSNRLKKLAKEGGIPMDTLIDYDFGARITRVVEELESIGAKKGWCIHDVQFMNVLVKTPPPRSGESRVALIDFEFVFQNYRAFDIGGHFMQKMFKWFDEESKIADCRPYSEAEKRHFCDEYAGRWNASTGDSDTGEQVYKEAELGYMLAITFDIHNMLCWMDQEGDKDPLNLLGFRKLFDEFVNQYQKLGLGE